MVYNGIAFLQAGGVVARGFHLLAVGGALGAVL
jgi:hypothetical protein